ncbi:MAG: ABC transporter family substrate-binding protein [Micromonosporaceae bacterium]|nr:ABC transporter family substrate-binding protein [Micromonosporaceae bacterium]
MRMTPQRWRGLIVLAVAGTMLSSGCAGPSGEGGGKASAGQQGLASCPSRPDDCNSGRRGPGGTLSIGLLGAMRRIAPFPETALALPGGNEAMVMAMIAPSAFVVLPSGAFQHSSDLLASQPRIVATHPQTVVYQIRPEARWSDGMPISARDFEYTWLVNAPANQGQALDGAAAQEASSRPEETDLRDDQEGETGYSLVNAVQGADNGKTVTVTFSSPDPDWKSLFSPLLPAQVASASADTSTAQGLRESRKAFEAKPAWSGGPYLVSAFDPGRQVEFVPNEAWYGSVAATLAKVVFRFFDDAASAVEALERGEVDGLELQPDRDTMTRIAALSGTGLNVQVAASHTWVRLDLNATDGHLAERAIREAIVAGISVGEVIEKAVRDSFPGAAPRLAHHLFPGQPGYRDIVREAAPDQGGGELQTARTTLAEAGYTVRDGRLRSPGGEAVRPLRLRLAASDPVLAATGDVIRSRLESIGLAVTVQPADDLATALTSGDFDLAVIEDRDGASLAGTIRRWRGADNLTGWRSTDSDHLLDRAAAELDDTRRLQILNRQDELMTAAAVSLPLYQRPRLLAVASGVVNIRANVAGVLTYNAQQWGRPV